MQSSISKFIRCGSSCSFRQSASHLEGLQRNPAMCVGRIVCNKQMETWNKRRSVLWNINSWEECMLTVITGKSFADYSLFYRDRNLHFSYLSQGSATSVSDSLLLVSTVIKTELTAGRYIRRNGYRCTCAFIVHPLLLYFIWCLCNFILTSFWHRVLVTTPIFVKKR
jgi:hypothetical protein